MADSAEVHALEILSDFKATLARYGEDVTLALQDVDFEIRRTLEWLTNEQRLYWQGEIRLGQQRLSQAKTELHRKRLSGFGGRHPDTSQEEKAVRRAEERLETAHRKLERVKRWVPELQHAVQEYRGRSQGLADVAEMLIPRQLARLERMIIALEEYAQISAPRAAGFDGSGGTTSTAGGSMSREPGEAEPRQEESATPDAPSTATADEGTGSPPAAGDNDDVSR